MKMSYDELMDNEFEEFEKFANSRHNMRDVPVRDKNKGQAIRARRKEKENMRAEQEKNLDSDSI